ncbi:hypothetical protein ABZ468_00785 [Streptomyces sp. NPDC005708]|uniref:hypothetical protein n=1 Tax=Streptomyces sp. NPDC005708 TaxID=3154564 RepID=UPI0033F14AA0
MATDLFAAGRFAAAFLTPAPASAASLPAAFLATGFLGPPFSSAAFFDGAAFPAVPAGVRFPAAAFLPAAFLPVAFLAGLLSAADVVSPVWEAGFPPVGVVATAFPAAAERAAPVVEAVLPTVVLAAAVFLPAAVRSAVRLPEAAFRGAFVEAASAAVAADVPFGALAPVEAALPAVGPAMESARPAVALAPAFFAGPAASDDAPFAAPAARGAFPSWATASAIRVFPAAVRPADVLAATLPLPPPETFPAPRGFPAGAPRPVAPVRPRAAVRATPGFSFPASVPAPLGATPTAAPSLLTSPAVRLARVLPRVSLDSEPPEAAASEVLPDADCCTAVFFATMGAAPSHIVILRANRAGTINRLPVRGNGARQRFARRARAVRRACIRCAQLSAG